MIKKFKLLIYCLSFFIISCTNDTTNLPNFSLTTLDNQIINNHALQNKVVVINFWATSCSTCIAEMPKLIEIYNKYKSNPNFEFLSIAMPYDAPMYVKNFTQSRNLPFKVGLDLDSHITKNFGNITLTPTTFIFAKGRQVQKVIGEPNWQEFDRLIANSLD